MSQLKQLITNDMKLAMKAKDKEALKAIRMILGAIKQKEIDERIELSDAQSVSIIQKMVKQRKDSIAQFSDAGRTDLVDIEEAELLIINNYMPKQLSKDEIEAAVNKAISETGADSMKDMGKVMGELKKQYPDNLDFAKAGPLLKELLNK